MSLLSATRLDFVFFNFSDLCVTLVSANHDNTCNVKVCVNEIKNLCNSHKLKHQGLRSV